MQRNVVSQLLRPHHRLVVRLSRCASQNRSSADTTSNSNSTQGSQEDQLDTLRRADQTSLRTTTIAANKLKHSINKLQDATDKVPSTLTNPLIPREKYILSGPRHKLQSEIPPLASSTLAAITHVQTHLQDLASEGYNEVDSGRDALREFELEISKWTQEEKEDTLRSWKLEEEARRNRLNDASARLVKFVKEVLQGNVAKDIKAPAFGKGGAREDRKVLVEEEVERPKPDVKTAVKAPASPSLADLQKQLEASVSGGKK